MGSTFKWLALVLIFFNVAYFVWAISSGSEVSKQSQAVPLKGEKIVLLSEVPEANGASVGESIDSAGVEAAEQGEGEQLAAAEPPRLDVRSEASVIYDSSGASCPSIGPFKDREQMKTVGKQIASKGFKVAVRSVETDSGEKYRVFIPPFETREEAAGELKRLRAKKIDSYIMSTPPLENAISLGIFSSKESALGLVKKMNSSGYFAEMTPTSLKTTAFWLDVDAARAPEKADQVVVSTLSEIKGLTRVDSPCKVVALSQ